MSDIKIIDNFLDHTSFLEINNTLMSNGFPWFWNESIVSDDEKSFNDFQNYQLTHIFYTDNQATSEYYNILTPILNKLGCRGINRIKANLTSFKGDSLIESDFHTDNDWTFFTSIYYLNTNNGYTIFEDGTKVESVANRAVTFKTSLSHTGTNCTNQKRRVLINFNYYK